jgi:hypothetical protein
MSMAQKIRTKPDRIEDKVEIGGWLDWDGGRSTYLWLGLDGRCIGTLSGAKLYRLSKAICKRFEEKS